jgi:hypothetical protein
MSNQPFVAHALACRVHTPVNAVKNRFGVGKSGVGKSGDAERKGACAT